MAENKNFIECELRGPITWNDFTALHSRIEKEWGVMTRIVELAMFAKGNNDIRIKINKNGVKLIFKYRAKKGKAKFEREINIFPEQLIALIDMLHQIWEQKWVLSYADKFEARRGVSSISFKFGSQIGDFFEIEELVSEKKDIHGAIIRIKKIAYELNLQLWDTENFDKITKQSWDGVQPEQLIKGEKPHPLIVKALTTAGLLSTWDKSAPVRLLLITRK